MCACGETQKAPGRQRCEECWLAAQPADVREAAADRRLAMVPLALRRPRVPKEEWPVGRRWCAGCQSFVRLKDCGRTASQCLTCSGRRAHAAAIQVRFGIDAAEYDRILRKQGGRCGICRGVPRTVRLAVDHDHKTEAVRGLLCSRCNHDLLGAAHDSIDILRQAVAYLEDPPARLDSSSDGRSSP
jgi:hypothetical protein